MNSYTAKCVADAKALRDLLSRLPVQMKSIRGRSLRLARQQIVVPRDSDGAYRAMDRLDGRHFLRGSNTFSKAA